MTEKYENIEAEGSNSRVGWNWMNKSKSQFFLIFPYPSNQKFGVEARHKHLFSESKKPILGQNPDSHYNLPQTAYLFRNKI